MHTFFIMILIITSSFYNSNNAMEKEKKSYVSMLFHYLDKKTDPITYITQKESIEACETVLKLDPQHQKHTTFERNQTFLGQDGYISKASRRQQTLLNEAEAAIFGCETAIWSGQRKPSHPIIEQIWLARSSIEGYFSPNLVAVLKGYFEYKSKLNECSADILKQFSSQAAGTTLKKSLDSNTKNLIIEDNEKKKTTAINEIENTIKSGTISREAFIDLVQNDNPTIIEKINNSLRKNFFDPVGHLTHSKTAIFSEHLLRFNPDDPGHSDDWKLDPTMPLHKQHVHKTFERERYLIAAIENAINDNDHATVLTLSHINPENPKAITISKGYFSPILKAMINGFIRKKTTEATAIPNPLQTPDKIEGKGLESCPCESGKPFHECHGKTSTQESKPPAPQQEY
jgi:hypothetical protein